jgi:hypothetical protein
VQKSENFTGKYNRCTFCSKTQVQKHAAGKSTFCSLGDPLRAAIESAAQITAVPTGHPVQFFYENKLNDHSEFIWCKSEVHSAIK